MGQTIQFLVGEFFQFYELGQHNEHKARYLHVGRPLDGEVATIEEGAEHGRHGFRADVGVVSVEHTAWQQYHLRVGPDVGCHFRQSFHEGSTCGSFVEGHGHSGR